jgi:nitrate/nitrite transporter NarK
VCVCIKALLRRSLGASPCATSHPHPLAHARHTRPTDGLIQAAGQAGSFTALYSVPPLVSSFGGNVNQVYFLSFCLSCTALACLGLARVIEKTAYGKKGLKSIKGMGDGHMHEDVALQTTAAGSLATAVMDGVVAGKKAAAQKSSKGKSGETDALLGGGGGGGDAAVADDEEEDDGDLDRESPELRARLEHNLRYLRCVPPLYRLVLFLGFGHLVTLGWRFYAVMGGIIAYSSAFYTFLAFGPKWLMTNYELSEEKAGQTAGIIAIFSMFISPSFGLIMDKRGGQRYVCFGAMVSAFMWFTIMGFGRAPPEVCIIFAGMSYSLLPASLYPLLPEVVPAESFTIVYAVLNSAINLVFSIVLVIAGKVLGEDTTQLQGLGPPGTWGRALAGGAAGAAARALQHSTDDGTHVDPKQFQSVFVMFMVITMAGCVATGSLALDAYRNGTGWVPLAKHH